MAVSFRVVLPYLELLSWVASRTLHSRLAESTDRKSTDHDTKSTERDTKSTERDTKSTDHDILTTLGDNFWSR